MLRPGLILASGGLVLALGGCGIFDGVDSVVRNLSGAADRNQGSYSQPLAVPPDYDLRPPPARAEKNTVAPAAQQDTKDKEKAPEELDTSPITATKKNTDTETKSDIDAVLTPASRRSTPASTESTRRTRSRAPAALDTTPAKANTEPADDKAPRRLVITAPDPKPAPKKVEADKKPEPRRVVVTAPPQPSESTGNVQPETRGVERTAPNQPSTGEDELLRRSGVDE